MTSLTVNAPTARALREIVTYLGIAYALAIAVAVALPHAELNLLLSVAIPVLTVGILTFTIHPRGTRRGVWRTVGLARMGWRAWPIAIAVPVVIVAGAYGVAVVVGAGRLDVDLVEATPDWGINVAISVVLGTVLILGEEVGWRGYLLPRFQLVVDKRRAAIATGFAHGLFHLPLILLATTYDAGTPKWFAAPMAVAVITAGGVFYAWVRDLSGTVWPVAVAHNVVNTVFDLGAAGIVAEAGRNVDYVAGETGCATAAVCVVLAAVLLRRARVWATLGSVASRRRRDPAGVR